MIPARAGRWIGLALLGAGLFAAALKAGSVPFSWAEIFRIAEAALGGRLDLSADRAAEIFIYIRLPRVLMAATVGALLAAAGGALQGMLRNPLADPYLVGISSGAALGSVVGVLLGTSPAPFACLGAGLTLVVVLMLSRVQGAPGAVHLVLAGAAIHSFFSSVLAFIISQVQRYEVSTILFWLLGSLNVLPYRQLLPLMALSALGLGALFFCAPALNLLAQGDETALTLGLPVTRMKWVLLLLCAFLTGLAVTFNGVIPFVGLIVPHTARLLFGSDHRSSLPASAFLGALLVAAADAAGRQLLAPQELPVGVVTAMLGAPFFLLLLRRERGRLL